MATTQNTFNGNGSNLGPFSFTFKWLESTDIKVSVGGVLKTAGTHYNLQGLNYTTKTGGQVLFTAGNAPPVGTGNVRVYRDTDDDVLSATFSSGSAIRAKDLNDNFTQNLYVTQEVNNNSVNIDGSNPMVGNLNMNGFQITNLPVPAVDTNAATKKYVDDRFGNLDIPGHTRWRKVATASQTTFSGTGDYGGVLTYSPTREQVYINGALQQRGVDYAADNGTSVVFTVGLTVGDVVDIICVNNLTNSSVSNAGNITYSGQFTGQTARTVAAKLGDVVSVKDFGAVGDGVADDTAAIQNAINNSHRKAVYFPRGIYKVTDTLNITVLSYSLVGERTERGQNTQFYRGGEYSAVRINFDPVDKTKFLVNMFQATAAINIIGPFEHKNLCFTLNGANGFQFGSETLTIDDQPVPNGQAYIHGVRFDNCNFESTGDVYGSDVDGTITLSNRRFIGLAKSFESVVTDCSFSGGDYGVRTYGCDKFNLSRCRLRCTRPLDFNPAATFTVQHTVTDFQCEGWLIAPIRNNGVELAVHNSRLELNANPPQGKGRYTLPSCTATVTANSNTLTFSRSMDNILIPGWSIIELSGGAETETCYVTGVNGTTVTISTDCFRFTWSGTATTVTRIHSFGPLHGEGSFGSYYTNISAGSALDCPAFVYVGGRGSMYLTNCFAEAGYYGNVTCVAVGNRVSKAQFDMNGQMVLNSCTALLTPPVPSPLIRVINWSESLGEDSSANVRYPGADTFDSLKKIERKWVYTPARYSTNANNNHFTTFKKVAGDAGTGQSVYAWFADSSNPYGLNLDIYDPSLPSTSSGGLKFLIRAKAVSGGTTLSLTAGSNLGGANIGSAISLSTEWKTYTLVANVPTQWSAGGTSLRLLRLTPSADVYIAGVALVDEDAQSDNTYVSNGIQKTTAHKAVNLTTGSGVIIARGSGNRESYKIKAYGWNTGGNGGYATVYAEYIVQANTFAGTYAVRGVSQLYKQKESINNSVIDLDLAITAAIVSSKVEITATATLTGSAGDTTSYFLFDIEALSEPSSMTLIPT